MLMPLHSLPSVGLVPISFSSEFGPYFLPSNGPGLYFPPSSGPDLYFPPPSGGRVRVGGEQRPIQVTGLLPPS